MAVVPKSMKLLCDREAANHAGVAQLVEHHVANVIVDGSSPFTRSHNNSGWAVKLPIVQRHGAGRVFLLAIGGWNGCRGPVRLTTCPDIPQ